MKHSIKLSKAANDAARKIDAVVSKSINDPDTVLSMDDCVRIAIIVQRAINSSNEEPIWPSVDKINSLFTGGATSSQKQTEQVVKTARI